VKGSKRPLSIIGSFFLFINNRRLP